MKIKKKMTLNELKQQLFEISDALKELGINTGFELDNIEYDKDDINERFFANQLDEIMQKLEFATIDLEYLRGELTEEMTLYKNGAGRYTDGDYEYTCGSVIEFCYYDDWSERDKWEVSTVEHNGEDYYIVRHKGLQLEGLKVRRRIFK